MYGQLVVKGRLSHVDGRDLIGVMVDRGGDDQWCGHASTPTEQFEALTNPLCSRSCHGVSWWFIAGRRVKVLIYCPQKRGKGPSPFMVWRCLSSHEGATVVVSHDHDQRHLKLKNSETERRDRFRGGDRAGHANGEHVIIGDAAKPGVGDAGIGTGQHRYAWSLRPTG